MSAQTVKGDARKTSRRLQNVFQVQSTKQSEFNTIKEKKSKLCLISSIDRKILTETARRTLGACDMCHYRVPGGGVRELVSGLEHKLRDFTFLDYCVIIIGESDFNVSCSYTDLVTELREKLLSVTQTNVILCLPTYRYSYYANIYNAKIEMIIT